MRRVCPSCSAVVFREHKVAAVVIVPRAREVLLIRRATAPGRGAWSLPGGYVEFDETPSAGAVRECLEETGLQVDIVEFFDVVGGQEALGGADIVVIYVARIVGGSLHAGDDADCVRFFLVDRLPPLAFGTARMALDAWIERLDAKPPNLADVT
jgi:8-oxo-dGTP diphosphatase